jgi:E3 ubiquitin-protein ligase synoviolin
MRRMGIESTRRPMTRASSSQRSPAAGVASQGSSSLGNPSTVAPDKEEANDIDKVDAPSIDPNAQSATTDHQIGEGKGKSKAIDPSDGHQADQPETARYTPFLTPAHAPLANSNRPWLQASNNAQVDLDPEGSLDERIRALRQVDEVVWGLISDLTRLKSKWESEGGAGPC